MLVDVWYGIFKHLIDNSGISFDELKFRLEDLFWRLYVRKVDNRPSIRLDPVNMSPFGPPTKVANPLNFIIVNKNVEISAEEFYHRLDLPGSDSSQSGYNPTKAELESILFLLNEYYDLRYSDYTEYDCYINVEVVLDLDDDNFHGLNISGIRELLLAIIRSRLSLCTKLKNIEMKVLAKDYLDLITTIANKDGNGPRGNHLWDSIEANLSVGFLDRYEFPLDDLHGIELSVGESGGVRDYYQMTNIQVDNIDPHPVANLPIYYNDIVIFNLTPLPLRYNHLVVPPLGLDELADLNGLEEVRDLYSWNFIDNINPYNIYGNIDSEDNLEYPLVWSKDDPTPIEYGQVHMVIGSDYINPLGLGEIPTIPGYPCIENTYHNHYHHTGIGQ